jgi:DNA-directed RNA polymerase subunit RPC12/RpoP
MALLLWSLATMMFNYAQAIPYNLSNPQIWFRILAIIIAIFGWIWLFKIYVSSVRAKQKATMKCPECNGEFEVENSSGRVPIFCPYCGTKGISKKGEK